MNSLRAACLCLWRCHGSDKAASFCLSFATYHKTLACRKKPLGAAGWLFDSRHSSLLNHGRFGFRQFIGQPTRRFKIKPHESPGLFFKDVTLRNLLQSLALASSAVIFPYRNAAGSKNPSQNDYSALRLAAAIR